MNRFKGKTGIAVLAMVASLSLTTLAAVPTGTVVMGDKGYDLEYTQKAENYLEVAKQFVKSGNTGYLKTEDGKWIDLKTKKTVEKNVIPQLIYKNAQGKIMEYLAEDGDQLKLNIAKASFVSKDKVVIEFNKEIDAELAADKANYKIGGKALVQVDKVEVSKDNKSVTITLNPISEEENFETNITISNDLTDKYGVKMDKSYSKNVLVINKASTVNNFKGDVCIIAEGAEFKDSEVEGNIYINADKVDVKGIKKVNNIFVNPGEKGSADIEELDAKGIVVLSGAKESVHLNKVNTDNLMISTKGSTRVELKGGSAVKHTVVSGDTILDAKDGNFGDVDISNDTQSEEQPTIELKGKFKGTIIVKGNTKVVAAEGAVIENLVIETVSEDDKVTLEGTFQNVNIKSESKVVLGKTAQVKNLKSEVDIKVEMEKGAKVEKTEGKVETTGDGKDGTGETVNTGGGSFGGGGGGYVPPTIPKIETKINNFAGKVKEAVGDKFKDYGTVDTSKNNLVINIDEEKEGMKVYDVLKELKAEPGKSELASTLRTYINDSEYEINIETTYGEGIDNIITGIVPGATSVMDAAEKLKAMSYEQIVQLIKSVNENGSYKKITVAEKELEKVYKVNDKGNVEFEIFNKDNKENKIATLEEIRSHLGIKSFKDEAKVSDLLGTYKVQFSEYTYTIVIK